MAIFKRPDAELYYEVHGSGFPFSAEIEHLAPNLQVQRNWRAPDHLAESIRTVGDFLTRHTS